MSAGSSLARCWRIFSTKRPKIFSHMQYRYQTTGTVSYAEPTTLLITCMDRRLNPDLFLKMDLGSTFIMRNPGNFVPHAANIPASQLSGSLAALEMTVNILKLKNVIVCGHSDCKAIQALRGLKQCCVPADVHKGPLATWLQTCGKQTWHKYLTEQEKDGYNTVFNYGSDRSFMSKLDPEHKLCTADRLSQINVLQQLENICSHTFLQDALQQHSVQLHGMWVDVEYQTTHIFNWEQFRFIEVQTKGDQVHSRT